MDESRRKCTSPASEQGSLCEKWLTGTAAGFVVVALIAFVVGDRVISARAAARQTMCAGSRLFEKAFFLRNYCHAEGRLPPAILQDGPDGPPYSWRIVAYRYGAPDTYDAYDRSSAWDSEKNTTLRFKESGGRGSFACPADKAARSGALTSYVAVVGKNTLWPGRTGRKIPKLTPEIMDTIVLIEIPDSDIPWTEPRDLTLEEAVALFRDEKREGPRRHPEGLNYITLGGQYGSFRSIRTVEKFVDMLCVPE